jgi:hypothetical protein
VNHAEWISSRDTDAPAELTSCARELLEAHPEWERLSRVDALIEASEALLRRVLEGGAQARINRANALHLLAADACVTWAFEAAADDPAGIAGRAERATIGIAAIAAEFA